jgi:hypothetical protein
MMIKVTAVRPNGRKRIDVYNVIGVHYGEKDI